MLAPLSKLIIGSMTHYPMMMGIVKQIINLHGHIHHYSVNIKEDINVGVDTPETDYLKEKATVWNAIFHG